MDLKNPFSKSTPPEPPKVPTPPGALPVVENAEILTHTMKEDILKTQGMGGVRNEPPKKTPFSEDIPAPPLPPNMRQDKSQPDMYMESVESEHAKIETIPMPPEAQGEDEQKLKIFIPLQKRNLSVSTIILSAILVLLIASGAMGYYFFFIKDQLASEQVSIETPIPAPAPIPQPAPQPEPAPEPIPEPQPTPEPEPQPIPEPPAPQAIAPLDQTVIIEIGDLSVQALSSRFAGENAKIAGDKVTLRYLIKLSTESEKRFLTPKEWTAMLGLKLPADFWQYASGMDLVGYKSGNVWRYGLIAKTNNKDKVKEIADNWQNIILTDLKSLYIEKMYAPPTKLVFSENAYFDFYKRYINLPTPDISLDYAVSVDYFVIATSKEMIYALLAKISPKS